MTRVLQTRMVGYAPDLRHPLAPREVVYVCEEMAKPRTTIFQRVWTLFWLGVCVWGLARAIAAVPAALGY